MRIQFRSSYACLNVKKNAKSDSRILLVGKQMPVLVKSGSRGSTQVKEVVILNCCLCAVSRTLCNAVTSNNDQIFGLCCLIMVIEFVFFVMDIRVGVGVGVGGGWSCFNYNYEKGD